MNSSAGRPLVERALDPAASVVIEACAGSGKTWLLVSRIVRLLLDGTSPSGILAITFTRKAAQEMAARLRAWLSELAVASDEQARRFLRERAVAEADIEVLLPRARRLYEEFLAAQPPITIATFHSWFLQILRHAPLDAGVPGDVRLIEQTSALLEEAWEIFASRAQREREAPAARGLDFLFAQCGLDGTQRLLAGFVQRRAEWQAYTRGHAAPGAAIAHALERCRAEMDVAPEADVIGEWLDDAATRSAVEEFAALLARNSETDRASAQALALARGDPRRCLDALWGAVFTRQGKPLARRANETQRKRLGTAGQDRLLALHVMLAGQLQTVRQRRIDQAGYRFNEAALHAGVALLDAYQRVKAERQVIDYADIEARAWELVATSEHALYMHYKLDARYRHVLLDEFQDTNPLQWLTLKSWIAAAVAAESGPTVFMVGDPKQSIYRFRRAEARLFDGAAAFLQATFGAVRLPLDESRRCPPQVIEAVNRLFGAEPAFTGFEPHAAHYVHKAGRVEVLPLIAPPANGRGETADRGLRNPLEEALEPEEDRRREGEAQLLVERLRGIHGRWFIQTDAEGLEHRVAEYRDIMILVRRRTHLAVYERALRQAGIPFVTSRQGGLLDTLEAQDMVALLEFLVAPFADIRLAHALRAPVFACSDEDLIAIAGAGTGAWWERLRRLAAAPCGPALARAARLLERWLARADALPVHDQLDRIFFEGDVANRYAAAVPTAMREAVAANLQAFMQRALDTDSGRYPSLPRFLNELSDLRSAPVEEAPDEGIVGDAGNAVRILTVHGAKGLQAPVVWLLDAAAGQDAGRGHETQVDWPPDLAAPRLLSLWARKEAQSTAQRRIAEAENRLAERENLNLLYVAMTRAEQALIVSGTTGRASGTSWYDRIRTALLAAPGALESAGGVALGDEPVVDGTAAEHGAVWSAPDHVTAVDARLRAPLPTGQRVAAVTAPGLAYGVHFHGLMDHLTSGRADREGLRRMTGLGEREFAPLWRDARRLVEAPGLARFLQPGRARRATNEISYVNAAGERRRIDRLVEFDDEVWVLDYKTGDVPADSALADGYRKQVEEYCAAMRLVFPDKSVRGLLVFSGGPTIEI